MGKTKRQAKLYKIVLSSLTITATVGSLVGYSINAALNKDTENFGVNSTGDIFYSKANVTSDAASLDSAQEFDNPFSQDVSDSIDSMDSWYNPDDAHYIRKGTTLANKTLLLT